MGFTLSLMAMNDVKNLSIAYFPSVCHLTWYGFFSHFLTELSVFKIFSLGSSLCILNTSPFQICLVNILSHLVTCLFNLFIRSLQTLKKFLMTHILFRNVLSSFQVIRHISIIFLSLIFTLISSWSENQLCMTSDF